MMILPDSTCCQMIARPVAMVGIQMPRCLNSWHRDAQGVEVLGDGPAAREGVLVVERHDVVEVALIDRSAAVGSAAVVVGVSDGAPQYLL